MFGSKRRESPRPPAPTYREYVQLLRSSPPLAQSYEALMSSVHLLNGDRSLKTLLFTSTQPEEGKTTVTVTLGLAMLLAGKKVLIVDADLRRPRVHRIFELPNAPGFIDVLAGLPPSAAIRNVEIPGAAAEASQLSVLPSGRPTGRTFDVIESSRLEEALRDFTRGYDFVLIDSPPILSVNDALLIAPLVNSVVLVVGTGTVRERDAQRAKARIEQAGGHVLGVVMNRFDERRHGSSFHTFHSYYMPPGPATN